MKKIWALYKKDMLLGFRDFFFIYFIIAPFLLVFLLKLFIPSASTAGFQFALLDSEQPAIIQEFSSYGEIELFPTIDEMNKRISSIDDIVGIHYNGTQYVIIEEGNEKNELAHIAQLIMGNYLNKEKTIFGFNTDSINAKLSPVATIGTVSIVILAILLCGMLIGLSMIEEKQSKTLSHIYVTPMSKLSFVIGKSLLCLITAPIVVLGILLFMGMLKVNILIILIITLISCITGIIMGFIIGIISPNQIAGVANMKASFMIITISIVGAILLKKLQWLLYWSPFYWTYKAFYGIVTSTITWSDVGTYSLWIIGLSALVFLALSKKIIKGIDS